LSFISAVAIGGIKQIFREDSANRHTLSSERDTADEIILKAKKLAFTSGGGRQQFSGGQRDRDKPWAAYAATSRTATSSFPPLRSPARDSRRIAIIRHSKEIRAFLTSLRYTCWDDNDGVSFIIARDPGVNGVYRCLIPAP
jgi:hypothetical protein